MRIELHSPESDKNWALHFHELPDGNVTTQPEKADVWHNCQRISKYMYACNSIFLQGDNSDWMMIEFWTDNQNLILKICESISEYYKTELEIS